jgi:hypothetical protein
MANTNAPFGLRCLGTLGGGSTAAKINEYVVAAADATALYVGDPVKSSGDFTSDGVPVVTRAGAGDTIRGVFVGRKLDPDNLTIIYREASTLTTIYVVDDPYAVFEIQTNGTALTTDAGANADVAVGSGSTVTGQSGFTLDQSSVTSSSAQLRILRKLPVTGNEFGAYTRYEVLINEHELKSTTGV